MDSTSPVAERAASFLSAAWANEATWDRVYRPGLDSADAMSLDAAIGSLSEATLSPPDSLVPVAWVDDWSFACVVLEDHQSRGWKAGEVRRWHLDDIDEAHQGALVDVDVDLYVRSLSEEFGPAWEKGYLGVVKYAERYQTEFVEAQITPKAHNLRPFQLACQNVIIGLAAFKQDVGIDGEAVPFWLTCDAPHVATHEGSRALSAILLCDSFQSGGTMEISFSGHAERKVPASLRRFARTIGIELGAELSGGQSVSPREARALFMAVTPMPADLRERCRHLVGSGIASTERLCYTLLAGVWSAVSLDFLVACASEVRVQSMLTGGANVFDRPNRAAEMELMRAAILVDTFFKRVDAKDVGDSGGDQAVRLFEDTAHGVEWRVLGEIGAIEMTNLPVGRLPWHQSATSDGRVIVLPRAHPIDDDFKLAERILAGTTANGAPVAVLTAVGSNVEDANGVVVLKCPVRLAEMDLQIERSLLSSTLGRA